MTNGGRSVAGGMASFMTKKKKYKFQVEVCLEELLEVPFLSAVLFAKLRLLDGGNFQDHSTRQEVRDHRVKWNAQYTFPCKMLANASTGVLERCVLRISVRKESKGGKAFTKLGFVDLNLAEFAGAGSTSKKALLEGYDARHRQDNSMLRISIKMNMLSGDILFKVPSPTHTNKLSGQAAPLPRADESVAFEPTRLLEEFSSGSLAGSIGSGSSGFGSLTKKRPALSDLVTIGQTLAENNVPITLATDTEYLTPATVCNNPDEDTMLSGQEPGHSRNSSNTSQMSKASGYSSIHTHSRQSSSGDSGHIRDPSVNNLNASTPAPPSKTKVKRPQPPIAIPSTFCEDTTTALLTPTKTPPSSSGKQNLLNNNTMTKTPDDAYGTPRGSITPFDSTLFYTPKDYQTPKAPAARGDLDKMDRNSYDSKVVPCQQFQGILRSKSDFEIPRNGSRFTTMCCCELANGNCTSNGNGRVGVLGRMHYPLSNFQLKSEAFRAFLTPMARRRFESTSLKGDHQCSQFDNDEVNSFNNIYRNPSASSLVVSETGSLDRTKAAFERRKKTQSQEPEISTTGRVEGTRVNPDHLIDELIKNTKLDPTDESAETSGLQLFIAKDGTAAFGSHEVKSQMFPPGVFTQVLMDDNR